jgi:hypothetical protein
MIAMNYVVGIAGVIVAVLGVIGIAATVVAWVLGEYYTGKD